MKKLLSATGDAAAGDVPIDVICSILSYLPVKSVLRFKCVSKSWCSLINDSHFKKSHIPQSHDQVFIFRSSDKYYSFYAGLFIDVIVSGASKPMESLFTRIPNPHICSGTKLLAACDGLLLVRNCDDDHLTLLNPLTREHRNLQDVRYDFPSSGCSSFYDLGYDSSTDDYKVFLRQSFALSEKPPREIRGEINILSVKTNCWRMVKYFDGYDGKNAVNLNGSLNWALMHYCSPEEDEFSTAKIVSFSLANETITEMKLPCYYSQGRR
ncbi:F-box protein CPR1-like [Mercurialis annua]|uniref:F-box protein CPR1-like n=1 Tax=Mercurialis annua TaxID=3986 RepID=UPI00215EFFF2|nr:F-box protein CPR1-like [Mercurialis annua]